jgi:methylglyoxal synthase
MKKSKNVALVAHDNRKKDLIEWAEWNYEVLSQHHLICTGTTGKLLERVINQKITQSDQPDKNVTITRLKSGPLGGVTSPSPATAPPPIF